MFNAKIWNRKDWIIMNIVLLSRVVLAKEGFMLSPCKEKKFQEV